MPTASETAPPVRPAQRSRRPARSSSSGRLIRSVHARACANCCSASLRVDREVVAREAARRRRSARRRRRGPPSASRRSRSRGCRVSLSIIFGVVPELMSAWKPEIAPQAMVMKTNGKTGPGTIGPPPSTNGVKRRHLQRRGSRSITPSDQERDRADLQVGGEVVARAEQHPHRQHAGDEAVGAPSQTIEAVAREREVLRPAPTPRSSLPATTRREQAGDADRRSPRRSCPCGSGTCRGP